MEPEQLRQKVLHHHHHHHLYNLTTGRDLEGRDLEGRDLEGRDLEGRDLGGRHHLVEAVFDLCVVLISV